MLSILIRILIKPLLPWAIRAVVKDVLTREKRRAVQNITWKNFDSLIIEIPDEPTLGAQLMVRLAALTESLYRSFLTVQLGEKEARDFTSKINWWLFRRICYFPWLMSRLFSSNRMFRVKRVMDWFMRFPYAYPGYKMGYVKTDSNSVGFDVHHCPPANYFKSKGLNQLCTDAFCDLDYPLADIWNVKLERPKTIAKGCDHCDFRFLPK